jgi:pentatricopeptide repeat protein
MLLKLYAQHKNFDKARRVLEEMKREGCKHSIVTYNTLITCTPKLIRWVEQRKYVRR